MEKEVRYLDSTIQEENRNIEGYAAVFNSQSNYIGFYETIEPTAITEDTIIDSDVFCWLNHDERRGCLARSKYGNGSLKLSVDSKGLKFQFESPKTQIGNEVLEGVRRGDISSSSFAFSVPEGGDKWEKRDGKYYRTITKISEIYDVSPVYQPAYSEANCECRSFEKIKKLESEELETYYDGLLEKLQTI